ncbi:MAG: hypothetical protein WC858_03880 [Parcubacteria group bacterium]|jgi:hypothetical protein
MIYIFFTIPFLGIITALLGAIIEQALAVFVGILWQKELVFNFYNNLSLFLIASAAIEEILKYSAIYFILKGKFFLRGLRLVLASLLLGLFWGITEVILIAYSQPQYATGILNFKSDDFLSAVFVMLLHALTAFTMGVIISTAIFSRYLFSIRVILLTIFIHLLFNFLIIQQGNFTNILVEVIFGIVFAVDLIILAANFKAFRQ